MQERANAEPIYIPDDILTLMRVEERECDNQQGEVLRKLIIRQLRAIGQRSMPYKKESKIPGYLKLVR